MASTFEQLILEIITRDRASPALDRIGVSAGDAAGNVDTLQRRLTEVGNKSATARLALAGDKQAIAQLDRVDAKLVSLDRRTANPDLKVEGAARAIAEISAVDAALDKIGKGGASGGGSAGGAAAGLTGMLTPMTGLIAAGVALAPLVSTLAVGLTGVGVAAYGIYKPISNAAQATGGLRANLGKLGPEQQQVALSLLALGRQYGAFEKELQPQILGDFNQGIKLAGTLMHDVEPVAKGTASAIGSLVAGLNAEFRSQTWQQFFTFMATTGVQDVRMLDTSLLNLVHTLPVIIQNIQPLTQTMLDMTAVISKLAALSADAGGGLQKTGAAAHQSAGPLGTFSNTVNRLLLDLTPFSPDLRKVWDNLGHIASGSPAAAHGIKSTGSAAQTAAANVQAMATATKSLMTAQNNAVAAQVAYGSAILTTANDGVALEKALDKSHGKVGLLTAGQRASFGAANQYITDLANQATQAYKSGHGTDAAMKAIERGLPLLDSAKTKNKQYWQEVQTLVNWLHRLQQQKPINLVETIRGKGQWSLTQVGGKLAGPTGTAKGWLVQGGIPGKDSVPIMAMPGEAVVPKHLTPAVAPFLKAHGVPGFAQGGIVPSYSGTVSGLVPWDKANNAAFTQMFAAAMAKAVQAGISAARSAAAAGAARGSGGPASGAVRALQAYAASLFGQFGWGANQLGPLIALWNGESGWNPRARNPSSGAFGIPQALPPGKMGAAAAAGDAAAQIRWGEGYIHSVYGTPANAYGRWLSRSPHWYGSGGSEIFTHPTVIGVGERGPERVDITPVGSHGARGSGPLVHIDNFNSYDATDPVLLGQRLSFAVTAASLGS